MRPPARGTTTHRESHAAVSEIPTCQGLASSRGPRSAACLLGTPGLVGKTGGHTSSDGNAVRRVHLVLNPKSHRQNNASHVDLLSELEFWKEEMRQASQRESAVCV